MICTIQIKQKLVLHERRVLEKCSKIIYESPLFNIIGLDVASKNIRRVEELSFVEYLNLERDGQYACIDSEIVYSPVINSNYNLQKITSGKKIFIIDSGVNDPNGIIEEHRDFTGESDVNDYHNHGTVVANIIKSISGNSKLYSLKNGRESPSLLSTIASIEWAIQNDADIINISSGFRDNKKCKTGNCILCNLISDTRRMGIIVVTASGNDGRDGYETIWCPGFSLGALTVGATSKYGNRIAKYSGKGSQSIRKPDLVTIGNVSMNKEEFYGTSFSTPIISGIVSEVIQFIGDIDEAIDYIYKFCIDLGEKHAVQGRGALDINALLEELNEKKSDNCS